MTAATVSPGAGASSIQMRMILARYGNLVYMERPSHHDDLFSRRHPKMTLLNRAKIFSPFAALVGFDECIRSKDVEYVDKHILDADEDWELNRRLNMLQELTYNSKVARANRIVVELEYFVPCSDPNNDAYGRKGQYRKVTGTVVRVDQYRQELVIDADDKKIEVPFSDIYSITNKGSIASNKAP